MRIQGDIKESPQASRLWWKAEPRHGSQEWQIGKLPKCAKVL